MEASIYYFSGTGNSLHAARTIAAALGGARVVDIARQKGDLVEEAGDVVGIVFPVYFYNPPPIVQAFARRLRLGRDAYVFAVATYGGIAGNALGRLDGLLRANGRGLSAGFEAEMPDNAYIGVNLVTPLEERAGVLEASEARLRSIAEAIANREKNAVKRNSPFGAAFGVLGNGLAMRVYRLPKRFRATEKCNGCGICTRICPAGNIQRDGGKVSWGKNCTECLACFHWCPRAAIEIGGGSAGIARYHHPAVVVGDMVK